ncbi:hypothetical protein JW835_05525 [bacterium]|nr:hypothetical protein [bacterium]
MRFILFILCISLAAMAQTGDDISGLWSTGDVELLMAMRGTSQETADSGISMKPSAALKKPGLGLIMSAAVPGTGEMYAGSWIKGVVFLGAEVALWLGYRHYTDKGDKRDQKYRAFADQYWIEADYWVAMANEASLEEDWTHLNNVTKENYQDYLDTEKGLRAYEKQREDYSHGLHVVKDQQYYEMIGKYDQFRAGWMDSDSTNAIITPLRGKYEDMEYDMDSMYKKAGVCAMVILANHVLSALDAVWHVNQYNRRIQVAPNIGLIRTRDSVQPAFSMRIGW